MQRERVNLGHEICMVKVSEAYDVDPQFPFLRKSRKASF